MSESALRRVGPPPPDPFYVLVLRVLAVLTTLPSIWSVNQDSGRRKLYQPVWSTGIRRQLAGALEDAARRLERDTPLAPSIGLANAPRAYDQSRQARSPGGSTSCASSYVAPPSTLTSTRSNRGQPDRARPSSTHGPRRGSVRA